MPDQLSAAPRVRYPSPPPALRWLRFQLKITQALAPKLAFRQAWKLFCTPRRLPAKDWEASAVAEARRRTVMAESGLVQVYEWGPAAAAAVVMVHGWEHRASFWRAWIAPLLAAGYRVLALDAPAHGASAGRMLTLPSYGAALQAVLATAGEVRAIVAHSFGAAVVAGLPVRLPNAAPLPRLVLLSAPVSPRAVAGRFADLLRLSPDVLQYFVQHMQKLAGREIDSFAVAAAGPAIEAEQVLLIHDEQDAIVPFAEGQQIAAAWPQVKFMPTHGLGHNRILRDAGVVQNAVTFIG
jgi:pimeloyl-ACP methyl ester carboxylesterase